MQKIASSACHVDQRPSAGSSTIPRVVVLADDLSGAAECAAEFGGAQQGTALFLEQVVPHRHQEGTMVWDLDAREASVALMPDLLRMAGLADTTFLKIDSLTRGNWADLTRLLVQGTGRSAVVCPALPRLGRGIIDGRLVLTDHESARLGMPAQTSVDLVASLKTRGLRVGALRAPGAISPDRFATMLELALDREQVVVVDAAMPEDLDIVSREIARIGPRALAVGSAGLAAALSRALGVASPSVAPLSLPPSMAVLVGSHSAASRSQLRRLAEVAGVPVQWWGAGESNSIAVRTHRSMELHAISPDVNLKQDGKSLVTEFARHLWAKVSARHTLLATGGDTARAVCDAAGVVQLQVHGQLEPGVCLTSFKAAEGRHYWLILKSGSFGDVDTLLRMALLGPLKSNRYST